MNFLVSFPFANAFGLFSDYQPWHTNGIYQSLYANHICAMLTTHACLRNSRTVVNVLRYRTLAMWSAHQGHGHVRWLAGTAKPNVHEARIRGSVCDDRISSSDDRAILLSFCWIDSFLLFVII